MNIFEIKYYDWIAEAKKRYGEKANGWTFVCPMCQTKTTVKDWRDANAGDMSAFSCIGRTMAKPRDAFKKGKGPCNYAGGGLFALNPITVIHEDGTKTQAFDFADDPLIKPIENSVAENDA